MTLKIASICGAVWLLFGLVTFLFMIGGIAAADEEVIRSWGLLLFIGKLLRCLIFWPASAMSFTFIGAWSYARNKGHVDMELSGTA